MDRIRSAIYIYIYIYIYITSGLCLVGVGLDLGQDPLRATEEGEVPRREVDLRAKYIYV